MKIATACVVAALAAAAFAPTQSIAQTSTHDPAGHAHHGAARAAAPVEFTAAELMKLDAANGKLTLKHGEIKHLDMPPMTMVFHVKDKTWLDGLTVGAKLQVKIQKEGSKFWVTELKRAP